jgi:hypothetical protein
MARGGEGAGRQRTGRRKRREGAVVITMKGGRQEDGEEEEEKGSPFPRQAGATYTVDTGNEIWLSGERFPNKPKSKPGSLSVPLHHAQGYATMQHDVF